MKARASRRPSGIPSDPAVEPHSLGRCLFLHLAPGIANIAATVLGLAVFWNPALPPELFFGVFTNVFVLIPVQLGYLYYLARKRHNPGWSLEGIVVYDRPISWSRYLIWVPAILAPTAVIFAALEPITHRLEATLVGVSVFARYQAPALSEVAGIVLFANVVLSGILVPITEELYFRGYLLPRMPTRFGRLKPAAHSLLFAMYHLDTPWMIPVRTLGILPLIYATMHTHSVRPGIAAHCLVNLANFSESVSLRIGTQ
ncbi:MAG: CPBP family intramembrane metalloprotease [Gammaproteobacteria bacterium]|nr:CPBP family intramembrane metalloprotease [Gammaproteobacteria bacterium]